MAIFENNIPIADALDRLASTAIRLSKDLRQDANTDNEYALKDDQKAERVGLKDFRRVQERFDEAKAMFDRLDVVPEPEPVVEPVL